MSSARPPKRARKKERRDARREAIRLEMRRRRRQRLVLLVSSLLLIAGGAALVFMLQRDPSERAEASPTPEDTSVTAATPEPVACDAELPKTAGSRKKMYAEPKDQKLDPNKTTIVHLETSCGDIDVELDVENSPKTSNSVAFLARERFYDGLVFHRIVPGFVIQGGDPTAEGTGGSGYDVLEPPDEDTKYEEGVVAMAKGGNDPSGTSGSQFFIVSGPDAESLPAEYAVLGKVVGGMDIVKKIEGFGGQGQDKPSEWTYIERATVVEQ